MWRKTACVFLVIAAMLLFSGSALAQDDVCSALIDESLSSLAASCPEPVADIVCYGFGDVSLTPEQSTFDQPGRRFTLRAVQMVETTAFDPAAGTGGIALLDAPAGDQSVALVMVGAVTLTMDPEASSPLSALQVSAVSTESACTPSMLILYSAGEIPVTLTLNGQTLDLNGLVVFTQANPFDVKFYVLDGTLSLTDGERSAQAGEVWVGLADSSNTIQALSVVRSIQGDEGGLVELAQRVMESAGTGVTDLPQVATDHCGSGVVHIVQRGETIFRIALRYGTTVDAIVVANNLSNRNLIHAGLELLIPCASSGAPPDANPHPDQATATRPSMFTFPDTSFPIFMPLFPVDLPQSINPNQK